MTGSKRILIVEDEPLIAMMIEDYLDILGMNVADTAETVAAALAAVERGGIDAAILDVNLSGGEQSWPVADVLAAKGIPFVLATGGSDEGVIDRFRDRPILAKPFAMDRVEVMINQLLP